MAYPIATELMAISDQGGVPEDQEIRELLRMLNDSEIRAQKDALARALPKMSLTFKLLSDSKTRLIALLRYCRLAMNKPCALCHNLDPVAYGQRGARFPISRIKDFAKSGCPFCAMLIRIIRQFCPFPVFFVHLFLIKERRQSWCAMRMNRMLARRVLKSLRQKVSQSPRPTLHLGGPKLNKYRLSFGRATVSTKRGYQAGPSRKKRTRRIPVAKSDSMPQAARALSRAVLGMLTKTCH
jgi:hypothetical protein